MSWLVFSSTNHTNNNNSQHLVPNIKKPTTVGFMILQKNINYYLSHHHHFHRLHYTIHRYQHSNGLFQEFINSRIRFFRVIFPNKNTRIPYIPYQYPGISATCIIPGINKLVPYIIIHRIT